MKHLQQETIAPAQINWDGLTKQYFNPGELETLCHLVKSVNPTTMIEFGVNSGRTAKAILREVPSLTEYVGVDVLPGYVTAMPVQRREVPLAAGHMVKNDKRVRLIVTKDGSHGLQPEDLPRADVVFIDGDHSRAGVEKDTHLARSVIKKGGLIIWHDYNDTGRVDVREVLHEYRDAGSDIIHVTGTWLAYELA